jgi:hypothetical protein
MILEKCKQIQGKIEELKLCRQARELAQKLQPVEATLTGHRVALECVAAHVEMFRRHSLLKPSEVPAAAKAAEKLAVVQENFNQSPERVTAGRHFKDLLGRLEALRETSDAAILQRWATVAARLAPVVDQVLIESLQGIATFSDVLRRIARAEVVANHWVTHVPASDEELATAVQAFQALRELLAQLPKVDDPEINAFLDATNTPEGASLDALTDKVVGFLNDNNLAANFGINRRQSFDSRR